VFPVSTIRVFCPRLGHFGNFAEPIDDFKARALRSASRGSRTDCIPDSIHLWSGMIVAPPRSRASRLSRMVSVMMLVLGIVAAPSVGPRALQRPHCMQHGATALHGSHPSASEHPPPDGSPAWSRARNHQCPHCPASECARVSPCISSTTTALSPPGLGVIGLLEHRVHLDGVRDQASSVYSPPDTPPPQVTA
jgi:hypothetical protein